MALMYLQSAVSPIINTGARNAGLLVTVEVNTDTRQK